MSTFYIKKSPPSLICGLCLAMLLSISSISVMAQNSMTASTVTDFLNVYNATSGKTTQLANEFPTGKFDWRPAEGIRSVKEVVLHVASGTYFFGSAIGLEIPDGVNPQTLEQSMMSKEEAVSTLEKAIAYIQDGLADISEAELNEKINFFGNQITKKQALLSLGDHSAEHLGQLIAYARMNGVVPPWSQ